VYAFITKSSGMILWRIDTLLGNGLVNTFQQTRGEQHRSGVFCGPCCARCYTARTKHFSTITDMFSMDPPRDYISSPFVKRNPFVLESAVSSVVIRKSEASQSQQNRRKSKIWGNLASLRQSLIVSTCNWLWLRVIVKEAVSKSNHPVQSPLLFVTEPQTRENVIFIPPEDNTWGKWNRTFYIRL
jgi:hypothetical protein